MVDRGMNSGVYFFYILETKEDRLNLKPLIGLAGANSWASDFRITTKFTPNQTGFFTTISW